PAGVYAVRRSTRRTCIDISSFKHSCWGLRVPSLVEHFHPGIDLADHDDAGRRNLLIVLAIVDGHVGARGPIGNVSDFVRMRPLAVGGDGSRQMAALFSSK